MPAKPPLFKQETGFSCAPACLRMVLASLGIAKSEEELRKLSDCSKLLGTRAMSLVEAARKLGFLETGKFTLNLAELVMEVSSENWPIVYLRTQLFPGTKRQEHAVVVTRIDIDEVEALDPWRGELKLSLEEFQKEWLYPAGTSGLAILVR